MWVEAEGSEASVPWGFRVEISPGRCPGEYDLVSVGYLRQTRLLTLTVFGVSLDLVGAVANRHLDVFEEYGMDARGARQEVHEWMKARSGSGGSSTT